MEITQADTVTWKPGGKDKKLQVSVTSPIVKGLAQAHDQLDNAMVEASGVDELLGILAANGWETYETNWNGTTFQNRAWCLPMDEGHQLRLIVSLSSKSQLTISWHVWYK